MGLRKATASVFVVLLLGCNNTYSFEDVTGDGGSDGGVSGKGDGGATATKVLTTCGTTANVDLASDANHCGTCSNACPTGSSCSSAVCCPAGSTACGGKCFDTTTSKDNCGACGVACSGICSLSRCVTALATGQQRPTGITADGTNVYWANYGSGASSGDGTIMSVPAAGGTAVTLAVGRANPWEVTVSGGALYWNERTTNSVLSLPTSGGTPATLASTGSPLSVATDGKTLYWANAFGGVGAVPVGGGTATMPAPVATYLQEIAVDASNVYWTTNETSPSVLAMPLGGGALSTIASGQTGAEFLAAYNGQVYWTTGSSGALLSAPAAGGTVATLASGSPGAGPLAVDSSGIYVLNLTSNSVLKVALSGGALAPFVTTANGPTRITTDASRVYWTASGGGNVYSVSK